MHKTKLKKKLVGKNKYLPVSHYLCYIFSIQNLTTRSQSMDPGIIQCGENAMKTSEALQ